MDYEKLKTLRESHTAWRLMRADQAPFVVSFLYKAFISKNRRSVAYEQLRTELDDAIYFLQQTDPEKAPNRRAKEYIEIWSQGDGCYLNQRYLGKNDEPELDLTSGAETAIRWLESLKKREFVGTESRLLTVFQLLQDLVQKTEEDPEVIISHLERQKKEIDEEIERVRSGLWERHSETQVRERFFQIEDTARSLLSDFRQIEENFRGLDRDIREKIATSEKQKGDLLDDVFNEHDVITESDQGKSFRAFWEFLMQTERQEQFEALVDKVLKMSDLARQSREALLPRFREFLSEAGGKVARVNNQLTNQLRKYIDDQGVLENKRILKLTHEIERRAARLAVSQAEDVKKLKDFHFEVDELKPQLGFLNFNRPFFDAGAESTILSQPEAMSEETEKNISIQKLLDQEYIDEDLLKRNISKMLAETASDSSQGASQVSLEDLLSRFPLEKGINELVVYLKIASNWPGAMIDEEDHFEIKIESSLNPSTPLPRKRKIQCPQVIFTHLN